MIIDLRWEGDDKNQYLFAGDNPRELAWLEKRKVQWSGVCWLPGIDVGKEFNTLAAHQKNILAKVEHWFQLALPCQEAAGPSEEPVAWRVRERPGFDWGLVRTDPDRDPHFHCWEKQPLFASPAPASPVAVSVKALKWASIDGDVVARTDIKSYCCRRFGDGFDLLIDGHHTKPYIHGFRETHPTLEAAKAAAQSDYESRILSSIIPATKGGEAEALRKLIERTENFWAFIQGEYGVRLSSEDQDDHNVYEFFAALEDANACLAALSAQDTDGVASAGKSGAEKDR